MQTTVGRNVTAASDRSTFNTLPRCSWSDWLIAASLTLASMVAMLQCASSELFWDEADYATVADTKWRWLWRYANYSRHSHGPMSIYLAKSGRWLLSAVPVSAEVRLRWLEALAGSIAIGLVYWTLRRAFVTSRAAALAGSGLLLFSVVRLEETSIIGPHHLMLLCTVAIAGLGYHWRESPRVQAAVGLGAVFAFGALSMTYVIPVALAWAAAVVVAGGKWIECSDGRIRVSRFLPAMVATAAAGLLILWPPGLLRLLLVSDFLFYLRYPNHPSLVGNRIFEVTPRTAAFYWLAHLEMPLLVVSVAIVSLVMWKALRSGRLSARHKWLGTFVAVLLGAALTAHLAGARNLLQFTGVLCLATGAVFDEALGNKPWLVRWGAASVVVVAALNLIWFSQPRNYTPYLATDGYGEFLKEERNRLREKAAAVVYALPVLNFYASRTGIPVAWRVSEMPWTTRADAPLAADVKYVLMPAFVYTDMPAEQPMRRIVAEHWKVVWSFRPDRAWELRLYENPHMTSGLPEDPGGHGALVLDDGRF